jgi:hypothetical protein
VIFLIWMIFMIVFLRYSSRTTAYADRRGGGMPEGSSTAHARASRAPLGMTTGSGVSIKKKIIQIT